jgi:hypothetical protein
VSPSTSTAIGTAGRHDHPLVEKTVAHLDRHGEQATRIAAQVEDHAARIVCRADRGDRPVQILERVLAERRDPQVNDAGLALDEPVP